MIRALLDTNVLISSIFWKGSPRKVVDAASSFKFEALISIFILQEIERVLLRPPFLLPPIRIQQILRDILSYKKNINEKILKRKITVRDLQDQKILEAAIGSKAQFLITGDNDLLVLKNIQNLTIISPSDFLTLL